MDKTIVPPIKSQGIKTKLVPWIKEILPAQNGRWIEPFMGTGVVGFNLAQKNAVMGDTNPHLIEVYSRIRSGDITSSTIRNFLTEEGKKLSNLGEDFYYETRKRFNAYNSPLDFIFLNRAGFNGMIRFNKKGEFNIPFCRKIKRFSQAYITKISNQVENVSYIFNKCNFVFQCQNFQKTIAIADSNDIIYCDPPYIERHADYYNGWTDKEEEILFNMLNEHKGKFILSTWHHNKYRENPYIKKFWNKFNIITKEHYYHVGGKAENRNSMTEALIVNFDTLPADNIPLLNREISQLSLFM